MLDMAIWKFFISFKDKINNNRTPFQYFYQVSNSKGTNITMSSFNKVDLEDIHVFCKAAENSSFTETAIQIGSTPSSVSKAIARLETKLALKLFERSTRSMRLTEEGQSYYEVCKESIANIQDIENQLTKSSVPSGTLRISVPGTYAITKLIPLLREFHETHSDSLKIEISLSTTFVNFTKDEFDLAIRIGDLKYARLIAKPLQSSMHKLVASPEYLAKFGTPKTLEDLHQHKCIGMKFPNMASVLPWMIGEDCREFKFEPTLICSDALGTFESVKNGFGISQFLDFTVEAALKSGELVEILEEYRPPLIMLHIVYPSTRYVPAKSRIFMDYLFKKLAQESANT